MLMQPLSSLLRLPTSEAIRANCGGGWLPFKIETISKSIQEFAFLSASLQTAEAFSDNAENYPDYLWKPVIVQLSTLVCGLIVNFL